VVHNETCLTFNDAHEINIKVEGDTDETGSYTETCLTSADDVHGVVKIRVEEDIGESGSCMETCLTSSGVAKEVIRTKAEEDTDELRSCTKTYLSSSADSHEVVLKEIVEGTDVEVENFAESVTFPEIKTDRQVRPEHCFVSIRLCCVMLCLYVCVCVRARMCVCVCVCMSLGGWFSCIRSHLCCEW